MTRPACLAVVLAWWTLGAAGVLAAPVDDETAERALEQHNASVEDDAKVECRRVKVTGSHFKRQLCHTRRQWDEIQAQAQADADRLSRGHTSGTGN